MVILIFIPSNVKDQTSDWCIAKWPLSTNVMTLPQFPRSAPPPVTTVKDIWCWASSLTMPWDSTLIRSLQLMMMIFLRCNDEQDEEVPDEWVLKMPGMRNLSGTLVLNDNLSGWQSRSKIGAQVKWNIQSLKSKINAQVLWNIQNMWYKNTSNQVQNKNKYIKWEGLRPIANILDNKCSRKGF